MLGTQKERLTETQFLLLENLPFTEVGRFSTIVHQYRGDLSIIDKASIDLLPIWALSKLFDVY